MEVFVRGKFFQASLIFASKAISYLSGAPFSTDITHKYWTSFKKHDRDKQFSLFGLLEVFVVIFSGQSDICELGQIPPEWSTFGYFTVLLATDMTRKYWTSFKNLTGTNNSAYLASWKCLFMLSFFQASLIFASKDRSHLSGTPSSTSLYH